MQEINNTQYFKVEKGPELRVSDVLAIVYRALIEEMLKAYIRNNNWE